MSFFPKLPEFPGKFVAKNVRIHTILELRTDVLVECQVKREPVRHKWLPWIHDVYLVHKEPGQQVTFTLVQ